MKNSFAPYHPGIILKQEIRNLGLTTQQVAQAIGIARKNLSLILNGHYSVSPEMAVRLSKAFNTSPDFWMNLQTNYDLYHIDPAALKVKKLR